MIEEKHRQSCVNLPDYSFRFINNLKGKLIYKLIEYFVINIAFLIETVYSFDSPVTVTIKTHSQIELLSDYQKKTIKGYMNCVVTFTICIYCSICHLFGLICNVLHVIHEVHFSYDY